jgi:arsenite-transporting ATPase
MARVIVYTGKGGVGKTSVAAATAVLCADRGLRTLVISTDIAHSLADALDKPLGPEPSRISPRLWGQESDVHHNIKRYWGTIQSYMASVFRWRGLEDVLADEMTILPGMDELASLLRIVDEHEAGSYDVIVLDAAPTGETARLLSLPEAARWWMDKMLPIQRRATQIAGPVLRRVIGMPIPDDAVFRAGEDLFRRLDRMHALLTDPERSSIRVVLNLERVVIREAQRSFTYFHLFGYPTDLVVCNRVLPDETGDHFKQWRTAQARYRSTVETAFAPVPIKSAPYFAEEVIGVERLRRLGRAIFGRADPAAFFFRGRPYRVVRQNGIFALTVELPFTSDDQVDLVRNDDELILRVGPWQRNLILPRALVNAPTRGATMDDGVLRVEFAAPPSH